MLAPLQRLPRLTAVAAGGLWLITGCGGNGTGPAFTAPAAIAIHPANLGTADVQMITSQTASFTAVVTDSNDKVLTGAAVSWSTNNAGVADVNATTGVVTTGASPGTATITASSPPASATRVVNVVAAGISYGTSIQPLWDASCGGSGCHLGSGPPAMSLDLDAGSSYLNLVDVAAAQSPSLKRVRVFWPDSSYLVHKLQGTFAFGFRMPIGAAPLSDATINLIRNWILQGAPNN